MASGRYRRKKRERERKKEEEEYSSFIKVVPGGIG
jgi:hypothetical protein